jgi:hypothetical protein
MPGSFFRRLTHCGFFFAALRSLRVFSADFFLMLWCRRVDTRFEVGLPTLGMVAIDLLRRGLVVSEGLFDPRSR